MGSFDVNIDGGNALIKKLQKAAETIQIETVKIINESVKEISNSAKAKVPVAKINGGTLKNSIGYSTYKEGEGATVYANARYAAYVEFGTGDRFQIPVYPNIDMNELEAYAETFKRRQKALLGVPHRPFMFNSYSEVLGKMVNKIKKIRI
jgi:HK97 gp10 family phage protein